MAGINTDSDLSSFALKIVSFNMHGFNQGWPAVMSLINDLDPGIILLQEHWLTPANLSKFDYLFDDYFCFGGSAMSGVVESGPLRGRPFGGLMCLINNALREVTQTVYCSERLAIVRIANFLIVNVYFPCVGTLNRQSLCEDLLAEIGAWCDQFQSTGDVTDYGG